MNKAARLAAAAAVALTLGIGSAVWATSPASAAAASARYIPKCTTPDLAVWVNLSRTRGAAGSVYAPLDFTNISGHECYLWAYPGVSAVTASGRQIGDAARRIPAYRARIVNLDPGATAHALLRYVGVLTTDAGCKATRAAYLKVYPEAQRTAAYAFFDLPSCTTTGKRWEYLMVSTVQPGT